MKKQLLALLIFISSYTNAQNKLFSTYTDAKSLAQDANTIVTDFIKQASSANKNIDISATAILNTSPYLVYWDDSLKTVNLPLWTEVITPQQQFFIALNDSNEKKGIEMFGLFFNGFYIAHELSHGIEWQQMKKGNKFCKGLYESEYFANTLAIIYWKQKGKEKELAACYAYAKKFVAQLPNPVPANEDPIVFFNTHYDELTVDPFKYGYYQFKQFVEIYEKQQLPSFSNYLAQKIPTEKSK